MSVYSLVFFDLVWSILTDCYAVLFLKHESISSVFFQTTAKSTGDVEIEAHDTDGKFVKLVNKGEDTVSIGGWTLKSIANNRETAYRFHTRQSLKPGDSITVGFWSNLFSSSDGLP